MHPEGHFRIVGNAVDWVGERLGGERILSEVHIPCVGELVDRAVCYKVQEKLFSSSSQQGKTKRARERLC
jgi:hypothetical protein